jgi:hypothetical protein
MTSKMTRSVLAIAFAVAMIAAFASPSQAALSTAERPAAAVTTPAPEATLAAAASSPAIASDAVPAPTVKAAPVTAAAPVAEKRKTIATKVQPRRIAGAQSFAATPSTTRAGYPCH